MSRIIGIDLGTTNSCVFVPVDGTGGLSVEVVSDELDRVITPSVVASDGGDPIVGYRAKARLGTEPAPVAFIKKHMGTDTVVRLGGEDVTPEKVSSIILKYLVGLASTKLGETVTDVVITVPQRFSEAAKQATRAAAEMAGLRVIALMSEPIAAAVAYGLQDGEDDLTIFCYDLGGGTFDATLLAKRRHGGLAVVKGGGVPDLGGYNFDKALANTILKHLRGNKYDLALNFDDPADQLRFQKLLRIAETAKIELSKSPECHIDEKEVFEDHQGQPVNVRMTISRREFESLIRDDVEETVRISREVFASAGIDPAAVGRVIMVGSSSRVPLVQQALREAFGREVELVDPDLIIARGAGMRAASLTGQRVEGITFHGRIPQNHPLDDFDMRGKVTVKPNGGVMVSLERADGGYSEATRTDDDGEFRFDSVELVAEEENEFELRVGDPAEPTVRHRFSVHQHHEKQDTTITAPNFITDPISILLANGEQIVFPENTILPASTQVDGLGTAVEGETHLTFEFLHGNHSMGQALLEGIPEGIAKGSSIRLSLQIDDKRVFSGTAALLATGQEIVFRFEIPKAKLPTPEAAASRLANLREDFSVAIKAVQDPTERAELSAEGKRTLRAIESELSDPPVDLPKVFRLLDEMTQFNRKLSRINVLDPPIAQFQENLDTARSLAGLLEQELPDVAQRTSYREQLAELESVGQSAIRKRSHEAWKTVNAKLVRLRDEMRSHFQRRLTPEELAAARRQWVYDLLTAIRNRIDEDVEKAKAAGRRSRLAAHETRFGELIRRSNDVRWADPDEANRLGAALLVDVESLEKLTADLGGYPVLSGKVAT